MIRAGWAVLALMLLAACGDDDGDTGTAPPGPSDPTSSAAATSPTTETTTPDRSDGGPEGSGTIVTIGDSEYGDLLVDDNDQAIYIFEPESNGTPACYDDCAEAWPPVLTEGPPSGRGDVDGELLGTVQRDDGGTQVTYNGWPLYFYAHEGPGEVLCHDVVLNGGLWLAIGPDGEALPT